MASGYPVTNVIHMLRQCRFRCEQHLTPTEIETYYFSSRSDGLHAFEIFTLFQGVFLNPNPRKFPAFLLQNARKSGII